MKIWRAIALLAVLVIGAFLFSTPVSQAAFLIAGSSQTESDRTTQVVTYTKDIAPILFNNCATCHRRGQIAPFSLLTYEDAAIHAPEIVWATASHYMPPWKAVPGYGEFKNSLILNQSEIALIQQWLNSGTPEGDPANLPPTPQFPDGDWQLGKPDLILKMPQPFTTQATGSDPHQCFVLPLNLPEDLYISAIEFKAGNSRVVHHASLYQAPSDEARRLDAQYEEIGFPCIDENRERELGHFIYLWIPGKLPNYFPNGVANVIPKGSDLILENHYHLTGKEETDISTVGIYLAKTKPQKVLTKILLGQSNLDIPPGEPRHQVTAAITIPIDIQVVDVMPHMHLLGQEMKVTAYLPDGTVKPMLWVKDWDFNWQLEYQYLHPVNLPKGTRLEMVAYFDNSSENPLNPNNPPQRVSWGMNTTDEMADLYITLAVEDNLEKLRKIDEFNDLVASEYMKVIHAKHFADTM